MVSVAKPWLICGYHGLSITKFIYFFLYKTMVNFHKRKYDLMTPKYDN